MEAVPRMPMLAFELKICTENVEFTPVLKSYIAEFYHENPGDYSKECADLDQLRHSAVQVSQDFMGCSTLKKYYCQLQFLQSRFPLGTGDEKAIAYTWENVYTGKSFTYADIKYEQTCILYNIGALHSNLGSMDSRQTPEGMKVSCTHFQCAAWAFQHLRDHFGSNFGSDMDSHLLTFKIDLMLAQAQECILEKSMTDNRKSSITAKVAAQIVEYYERCLKALENQEVTSQIGSRRYKDWKRKLELKSNYHRCVMYLYLGTQAEEQQKWGERLIYYQSALEKLNESIKLAKADDDSIEAALQFTMDVVGGKYNAAKKDNDFVYHEKVPALDSLPEIKGASLVKGIPFNPTDPEVAGQDFFHKLVPMEAHEASSLYSEEKAKLLRQIGEDVEEKDTQLNQYMSSSQLDSAKLSPEDERLPQNLLEKCAAISVQPNAIKDLVDSMQSLSSVATDVECNIKEILALLEEEEKKEKEYQEVFGKRTPNIILSEVYRECKKYEEALTKAGHSNVELHKAMNTNITNLRLLSGPLEELQMALPSPLQDKSVEDEAVISEVKRLLGKVDEMTNQRKELVEKFRNEVHQDDVTSSIVTREDISQQEFFAEQIKKHDGIVDILRKNLGAQDNILKALTEANAKYAKIRKNIDETARKRESMIQNLIQSCIVYEDLLAKSQKGVDFYSKLELNVQRLLDRTRGVCKVQDEERQLMINRLQPKAPPPARPMAPKPNAQAVPPGAMPGAMAPSVVPVGSVAITPAAPPNMAESAAPKLKDFLPFLKPNTFGPKAGKVRNVTDPAAVYPEMPNMSYVPNVAGYSGSLPTSQTASPVHLARQPASVPASPAHSTAITMPDGTMGRGQDGAQNVYYTVPSNSEFVESSALNVMSPSAPGAPSIARPQLTQTVSAVPGPLPTATVRQPLPVSNPGALQTPVSTPQYIPPHSAGQYTQPPAPSVQQQVHQYHQPAPRNVQPYTQPGDQHVQSVQPPPQQFAMTSQTHPSHQLPTSVYGYYPTSGHQPHIPAPASSVGASPYTQYTSQYYGYGTVRPNTPATNVVSTTAVASQVQGPADSIPPGFNKPTASIQPFPSGTVGEPGYQNPQLQHVGTQPTIPAVTQPVSHPQLPGGYNYPVQQPMNQGSQPRVPASVGPRPPPPSATQAYPPQPQVPPAAGNYPTGVPYPAQNIPRYPAVINPQDGRGQSINPAVSGQYSKNGYPGQAQTTQTGQPMTSAYVGPHYPGQANVYQTGYPGGGQYQAQPSQHSQPAPASSNIQKPYDHQHPTPQDTSRREAAVANQYSTYPNISSTVQLNHSQVTSAYSPIGSPYMPASSQSYAANQTTQHPLPGRYITSSSVPNTQVPIAGSQPVYGSPGFSTAAPAMPASSSIVYPTPPTAQIRPRFINPGATNQGPVLAVTRATVPSSILSATGQSGSPSHAGYGSPVAAPVGQLPAHPPGSNVRYPTPTYNATGLAQTQFQQPGSQSMPPQGYNQPYLNQQGPTQAQPATGYTQYNYQQPQTLKQFDAGQHGSQSCYQQPSAQTRSQGQPVVQASTTPGNCPAPNPGQIPAQPGLAYQQTYPRVTGPSQMVSPGEPPPNLPSPLKPIHSSPHRSPSRTPTPTCSGKSTPPQETRASSLPPDLDIQNQLKRQSSAASTTSSLDDLLSTSPDSGPQDVLVPKVITAEDRRRLKQEELRNNMKQPPRDPYVDEATLMRFVSEVERFEKQVDALAKNTLNGPTPLDKEWKDLNEQQEIDGRKSSMAIARCYPLKNRQLEIMPFDNSRVVLAAGKDDYINASHIGDLSPYCPKFIASQAPLPATCNDFWQMIYEQGTEVIVMLANELPKNHVYWPTDKGQLLTLGPFNLSLQSAIEKPCWVERIISLTHRETHQSRSVVHLQFPAWSPSGAPESPAPLLQFIAEVHYFYTQQRTLMKPVLVHCSNGVGRTGSFCVIYTGVQQINQGNGLIDVADMVLQLRRKRKHMVQEREQLQFCYHAILYHAQDILMKRGILTNKASFGDKLPTPGDKSHHQRKPSEDFILGTATSLSSIQNSVAKLNVKPKASNEQADLPCEQIITDPGKISPQEVPTPNVNQISISPEVPCDITDHPTSPQQDESRDTSNDVISSNTVNDGAVEISKGAVEENITSTIGTLSTANTGNDSSTDPQLKTDIPLSLADLQNPVTFTLSTTPPNKRKITKSSFSNKDRSISDAPSDPTDPFGSLDPLWSHKNKPSS